MQSTPRDYSRVGLWLTILGIKALKGLSTRETSQMEWREGECGECKKMIKDEDKYGLFDEDLLMLKFWCSGVLLQTKFFFFQLQEIRSNGHQIWKLVNLSNESSFQVWA